MNKKILTSVFLLCISIFISNECFAQYAKEHFIAPAPWQYWSKANELIVSTTSEDPVTVVVKKSDGTELAKIENVKKYKPVTYYFEGEPSEILANEINTIYKDRGLFIQSSAPILITLRNIASDVNSLDEKNIKGNASLVSFGEPGKGTEFRLGYYRKSSEGLHGNGAVYSVMATEPETKIQVKATTDINIVLNKGESYLFQAPVGSLLNSNKPVVVNAGQWADSPELCPDTKAKDATIDQVPPVNVLGTNYLVMRGAGKVATAQEMEKFLGAEQTLVVASSDKTVISIQNYKYTGQVYGEVKKITLEKAGDYYSFYHGDAKIMGSFSTINSDKPIVVYSGTADTCDPSLSTVLPIGECSGIHEVQVSRFINLYKQKTDYYGYVIVKNLSEPVFLGNKNLASFSGVSTIELSGTDLYVIYFRRRQIKDPKILNFSSKQPFTLALVQQQTNLYTMSSIYSNFSFVPKSLTFKINTEDCSATLHAEKSDEIQQYEWFLNGNSIHKGTENHIKITESGKYSFRVKTSCGWSSASIATEVEVPACISFDFFKKAIQADYNKIGQKIVYELKLINTGKALIKDIKILDQNTDANSIQPSIIKSLKPSEEVKIKAEHTITYDDFIAGEVKNQAQAVVVNGTNEIKVLSDDPKTVIKNDATIVKINRSSDIQAIKTDGILYYKPGQETEYGIKVINNGPSDAVQVVVEDKFPEGVQQMFWKVNNAEYQPGELKHIIKHLKVGEERNFKVKLIIPKEHRGDFVNNVTLTSQYNRAENYTCKQCKDTNLQEVVIPKGISPNGDNINDTLELSAFRVTKITIFNRYGKKVYAKTDYTNQWYGQSSSNDKLPDGVYFYQLEVEGGKRFSGYINLIR